MAQSKPYLYQEIAESLRRRIIAGELAPGERLPAMRGLAQQWGCTPGTVSRAYAQLAEEGLVTTHQGSGTRVTSKPLPEQSATWQWATLVNQAEHFLLEALNQGFTPAQSEAALAVAISRWRDLRTPEPVDTAVPPTTTALRFAGSHDLAVELLSQMVNEYVPGVTMSVNYVGSLGGLIALARHEADVAGSHLWDAASDSYNQPFVRRILPGEQIILFTLFYRWLGILTPPGNPKNLHAFPDLARADVRIINRQPGSGTRVWLDTQLQAFSLHPDDLSGYETTAATHMSVARTIAEGKADAGIAIQAAAAAHNLTFIPLIRERYDLVMPVAAWESEAVAAVADFIDSDRFTTAVAALGGYEPVGEIIEM